MLAALTRSSLTVVYCYIHFIYSSPRRCARSGLRPTRRPIRDMSAEQAMMRDDYFFWRAARISSLSFSRSSASRFCTFSSTSRSISGISRASIASSAPPLSPVDDDDDDEEGDGEGDGDDDEVVAAASVDEAEAREMAPLAAAAADGGRMPLPTGLRLAVEGRMWTEPVLAASGAGGSARAVEEAATMLLASDGDA